MQPRDSVIRQPPRRSRRADGERTRRTDTPPKQRLRRAGESGSESASANPGARAEAYARTADLGCVAELLARHRDEVLERWLAATCRQPFHECHHESHVADHIPPLVDAIVALLRRAEPRGETPDRPLEDDGVRAAACEHANTRFEQGLRAPDIVAEFRLLRQEVWRVLRLNLPPSAPASDVLATELLVNDALDAAITLALDVHAQRADEARDDFLATTVHDLRQPLTVVKANVQLARRGVARPEPDLARVDVALIRAESESARLIGLVAELADVSRLSLGGLQPRTEEHVDLLMVVHDAVAALLPEQAARVHVSAPSGVDASGTWDPSLLDRLVENLVSNALKYSPGSEPVEVALDADTQSVYLTVTDRGIGLDPTELAGLFRRYYRTSLAREQGIRGLGLGLYLSRGIVEAHGGEISARSEGRGRGTSFLVRLPRAPRTAG